MFWPDPSTVKQYLLFSSLHFFNDVDGMARMLTFVLVGQSNRPYHPQNK